ncbi:MAG TPA: hypothetical protein VF575_02780 [Candidatus Saccharimonadales bacterium]
MSRKEFLGVSALAVVSLFGIAGLLRELSTSAATPAISNEPENGTASGTSNISDTTASGSTSVKFGTGTAMYAQPTDSTTGIATLPAGEQAAIAANVVTGTVTLSTGGTPGNPFIYELKTVERIVVAASYVRIRKCKVVGGPRESQTTTDVGLIQCTSGSLVGIEIEDCTIDPVHPNEYISGIRGHHVTLRRNRIKNVTDGFDIVGVPTTTASAEVYMYGNYISDLAVWMPDRAGNRPNAHNDCMQIPGWGGVYCYGNRFSCNASSKRGSGYDGYPPLTGTNSYAPSAIGQCIGVTQNVSAANHPIVIEDNWFAYGATWLIWIKAGKTNTSGVAHSIKRNVGNYPTLHPAGGTSRPFVIDPSISVPGIPTITNTLDTSAAEGGSANVYTDNSYARFYRSSS